MTFYMFFYVVSKHILKFSACCEFAPGYYLILLDYVCLEDLQPIIFWPLNRGSTVLFMGL